MYLLERKAHFSRKLRRLLKKDKNLATQVGVTLKKLAGDPRQPDLKSHKVIAEYDGRPAFSSRVTGDLRIIWRYGSTFNEAQLLDLIDVGGHSGTNKVYR